MRALREAWMEFKGIRSDAFPVELLAMPVRTSPALNGHARAVAGRSGTLFTTDGSFSDVMVTVCFDLLDGAAVSHVNAWLTGEGLLRFSDEPALAYEARVLTPPRHAPVTPRLDLRTYAVSFSCKPFRVQVPAAKPFSTSASGDAFFNPGTAPALPVVTISGSGDFAVTIAGQVVSFFDIDDGIVVDCDAMDATTLDGNTLLNHHMTGTPWQIPPGRFEISWTMEEGHVDEIAVLPRWRWM